jgi:aryl-alcohol dehydrogenase-like predicted oxidoreductase
MLSGKYRAGKKPAGSRITINQDLHGRVSEQTNAATDDYVDVAQKHGLDPSQMALAFCRQRPFVTSTIIGATSLEQLEIDIGSFEVELSAEVLKDIHRVYRRYPAPI